jgi:hypothetical protein
MMHNAGKMLKRVLLFEIFTEEVIRKMSQMSQISSNWLGSVQIAFDSGRVSG